MNSIHQSDPIENRIGSGTATFRNVQLSRAKLIPYETQGPDFAGERPGVQLKLGLTKTSINNARQLSRSLVPSYGRHLKLKRFGGTGRPSVGGRPGTRAPTPKSGPVKLREIQVAYTYTRSSSTMKRGRET